NYQFLTNILTRNRLYDKAVNILLSGRKKIGNPSLFDFNLANLYFWKKDYVNGVSEYLKILKRNPKMYNLVEAQILSIFPSDADYFEVIINLITKEFENDQKNQYFHNLLADIYFVNKKYDLAFNEYACLDTLTQSKGTKVLRFAEKASFEKEYIYAIKGYEYVKLNYPDIKEIVNVHFGLANSLARAGRPDEIRDNYIFSKRMPDKKTQAEYLVRAVEEYESIIKTYRGTYFAMQSHLRIGEIKLKRRFDVDGAIESYEYILTNTNSNITFKQFTLDAMIKIADCLIIKGDLSGAEQQYDAVIKSESVKPNEFYFFALFKKARVYYYRGNFDEAKDIAQGIIMKQSPKVVIDNDILDFIMFIEGNTEENLEALSLYAKAELLARQRKYSEAVQTLKELSGTDYKITDDALFMTGKLTGDMGDYAEAVRVFREIIDRFPDGPKADESQLRIGELYEQCIGDFASAEKEYEQFLINYPQSIFVDEVRKRMRMIDFK
ncbi:tetratricopeptide repeat protein, partial [bacterium]|nr:tetratricopeptide repeat protein [bacterium]